VSIIGGVLLLFVIFMFSFFAFIGSKFEFKQETVDITDKTVLTIDLARGAQEYTKQDPFSIFSGGSDNISFLDILTSIDRAKTDDNIKGIFLNIGGRTGRAKSAELQEKLAEFKKSGKFIYGFIESGDEQTYYNTLVADSIFMPTEGLLEFNGYGISNMFMTGLFKKLGVEFHVVGFEDFKSAADSYDKYAFSDSARYQLEVLLNEYQDQFVESVAKYRKIDKAQVLALLNQGLFTTDSLYKYGLIDGMKTKTQVQDFIKQKLYPKLSADSLSNKEVNFVSIGKYNRSDWQPSGDIDEDKTIAIINAVGEIHSGEGKGSLFGGNDYGIYSSKIVEEIRDAASDDDIDAIILRIDSPGGSVIASDEMWEAIMEARKKKKVIASMSDVAASGGYYMAMACDKIIAHPSTITGSIGVILAIPNFSGTLGMLDITADTISTTESAQFLNPMYKFTDKDKDKLYKLSKTIYYRFLSRVAESRGKTVEQIREVAKGRVWTGQDAKDKGLVDELGGLQYAVQYVKDMLGVKKGKKVYIETYPKKVDDVQALLDAFGINSKADAETRANFIQRVKSEFSPTMQSLILNMDYLSPEIQSQVKYSMSLYDISKKERVLMAMPNLIDYK
jgi:protease-4